MKTQKNRRILLIDDQKSMHEDYRKVIGQPRSDDIAISQAAVNLFGVDEEASVIHEAYDIDSAYQGEDGFSLVQRALDEGHPYALAFVDVRMPPGWDGVDTIKRIWEIDPEILIVICTAYSDYSWEQTVAQLGQSDRFLILKKPFEQIEVRQFAVALTERWNLARTDVLTGLSNRRAFAEHLQREHGRALRCRLPLSCAMLDLDYFKRINDELGHSEGDAILQSVAELLNQVSRPRDHVFRFGGEEFCVLLPETDESGACIWADKCRIEIGRLKSFTQSNSVRVHVSIGVAALNADEAPEALVERTDAALRSAKQSGRNRVVSYSRMRVSDKGGAEIVLAANRLDGVTALEVMASCVAQLHSSDSIYEAENLMLSQRVSSVPVIDHAGKLVGVISDKEIISQMIAANGQTIKVGELMSVNAVCYTEDSPLVRIFDFLSRVSISQVFIVRDGRPVGIITRAALLRWLSGWLSCRDKSSIESSFHARDGSSVRVRESVEEIARRAALLAEELTDVAGDSISPLVDIMFKMQELMNDLVVCSDSPWPVVRSG